MRDRSNCLRRCSRSIRELREFRASHLIAGLPQAFEEFAPLIAEAVPFLGRRFFVLPRFHFFRGKNEETRPEAGT